MPGIPSYHPLPAPPNIFHKAELPINHANLLSRLVFHWATPVMKVGYSRPLEADDLWSLTEDLQCRVVGEKLQSHLNKNKNSLPIPAVAPARDDGSRTPASATTRTTATLRAQTGNDQRQSDADAEVEVEAEQRLAGPSIRAYMEQMKQSGQRDTLDELLSAHRTSPIEAGRSREEPPELQDGDLEKERERWQREKPEKKYEGEEGKGVGKGTIEGEGEGRKKDVSLVWAMYATVRRDWWSAVILKGLAAGLQITSPILTKLLINQLTLAHQRQNASATGQANSGLERPKSVGYGVGLAFALFAMLQVASLCSYQALQRGAVIGFMMRAALIDLISRKSMRLSSRSKVEMTNGRLTTMVSADASFLDFSAPMTLDLAVQPVQILVGLGLLIWTLGYSAVVGLAVLALAGPIQAYMFARMVRTRRSQLTYVDARVRLLSEAMTNIRALKLFAYVSFFSDKVSELRRNELKYLRKNGLNRASMNAVMAFVPTLAAVLTFVTYGLNGHTLDAAIIFSGLQYFNVLKTPISFLPMCFTAVSDALVGIGRIDKLLRSEEMAGSLDIDVDGIPPYALNVQGDFQFEALPESIPSIDVEAKSEREGDTETRQSSPFALRDIDIRIPRGALVCIIGPVGSGKSALLSGLLGDMRQISGHTIFGGDVSYVSQGPWIHSGSIRDNITFSASADEIDPERLSAAIDACALRDDLDKMPDGVLTNVGEKGLLLSGGQRQRLSLARAAYAKSSIVILDDPLSAVDPNVAHHILQHCILSASGPESLPATPSGPLSGRTRVMVTHSLEVVQRADWVLVLDKDGSGNGSVVQQGTPQALRRQAGAFRSLMKAHSGNLTHDRTKVTSHPRLPFSAPTTSSSAASPMANVDRSAKQAKDEPAVQRSTDEERETGSVSWSVYRTYLSSIGSYGWTTTMAALLIMTQVSSVANSLFLGWWSAGSLKLSRGSYMAIYAALGFSIGFFTLAASYIMFLAGLRASYALFGRAWERVVRAPMSWHDQTPSGRIISRLSKDVEMLDDRMAFAWETLLVNALAVVGTFGLVVYTYPWLGLAFIPLSSFYYLCGNYYRQTSREIKRLDSMSRSRIYTSFGEQLAGSSVIRAFGKQKIFEGRLQNAIDAEGQAYILTLVIQRWLGVRLDLSANLLVLLIAIMGTTFRSIVDASKFGVVFSYALSAASLFSNVFSYALSAASLFSNLVSLYAQVELEMNNAERIMHYTALPSEPPAVRPTDPPPSLWPSAGEIKFTDLSVRYSSDPTVQPVLNNLSFSIPPGEKVGVIGRSGAGKSSLVSAIMGTVEYKGSVEVDGVSLKGVGVDTLRSRIGIIPQDPFLFEGTIRSNIDPLSCCSDAHLHALLALIQDEPWHSYPDCRNPSTSGGGTKFSLDDQVSHEGSNLSAGEKQLLSLLRALARKTKILILDEATSSVDPETDEKIQRFIQTHLHGVTLISIAHRLQTVAYYDRILVLDQGSIAEADSPLALFDKTHSIFRRLCDGIQLTRPDLVRLRSQLLSANAEADAKAKAKVASDAQDLREAREAVSPYNHWTVAQAWAESRARVSEYLHD